MSLPSLWAERSAKERRIIIVAGALIAALLLVTFVWLPVERSRARLAVELPQLRASIAALQRDADEVKRLRSMPLVGASSTGSLPSLAAASPLPGAQLAVVDDKHLRLTAADVSFSGLVEWLTVVQASHGLRVESARIEALPVTGRVRAELGLGRS
jgi:type II secretory pathway component PulM